MSSKVRKNLHMRNFLEVKGKRLEVKGKNLYKKKKDCHPDNPIFT